MHKKIIVLAGNKQQYEEWLREVQDGHEHFVYGHSLESIAGVEASHVICLGTFYENPHHWEILGLAKTRIK